MSELINNNWLQTIEGSLDIIETNTLNTANNISSQALSTTSADGVNSDTAISGGNWSADTYTGAGEENDYAYVGVALQVDEGGTLYFDFSPDGTNWSAYPVNGFTIASGINEVHTAWKGGRYMRPRFVGTGGRSYFRLKTFYSNLPLPLTAPLTQSINDDQDATVVRAVNTGQIPDGTYINNPADGAGFRTTATVAAGATYDSGVLNLINYTQVGTSLISDKDGTIRFIFGNSPTMSGTTVGVNGVDRVISVPYLASTGYQYFAAPAFTPYVRYEFTNDEGTDTTQFFFDTRFLTKPISGQLLRMDAFISPAMVANLGRNVIVGTKPNGNFGNVSITETTNDAGTYQNLNVVSGARPSQISGRTKVEILIDDVTTSSLQYTVTANKTLYVTDILITIDNAAASSGTIKFEDGIIAAQPVVTCFKVADPAGATSSLTTISHSFLEPLQFDTGIWLNEAAGTLTVCGTISGYEE